MDDVADDSKITISREEYDSLKADSRFLAALHAAGVDNWDFYDEVE